MHSFLVCDANYRTYKEISEFVGEALHDVEIFYSDSLENWSEDIKKQLAKKNDVANTQQQLLSELSAFEDVSEIQFTVSAANGSLESTENYAGSFFGHPHSKWSKDPLFWRSLIDRQDTEKMSQFLSNLRLDQNKTENFRFLNSDSKFNLIKISGELLPTSGGEEHFQFVLTDLTKNPEKMNSNENKRKHLDLILVDAGKVLKSPKEMIANLRERGKQFNGTSAPKIIVLGHEDKNAESADGFALPNVVDFLYKPLDGLLFLEKITSHVPGISKKSDEPFLFSADTSFNVEVAQELQIAEISPFGLQIRAPFAVKPKLSMKLYSSLFGGANSNGLWAQCYINRKEASSHYSDCSWFGILPEQLAPITEWYGENIPADKILSDQEKLDSMKKEQKKKKGPVIHGAKPKKIVKKHILVIDLDEETTQTVEEIFENQGEEYQVTSWGSIHQAARDIFPVGVHAFPSREEDLIDQGQGAAYQKNNANRPAFSPDQNAKFTISLDHFKFSEFIGFPQIGSKLFGNNVKKWIDQPTMWKDIIDKRDKHRLHDFLSFIVSGQKAEARFNFENIEGHLHKILLKAKAPQADKIEIEMCDETLKSHKEHNKGAIEYETIELIIIDHSFVSYRTGEWMQRLRQLLDDHDHNPKKFPTPILLTGSKDYLRKLQSFPGFCSDGMLAKPFDKIHFLQFLELYRNNGIKAEKYSLLRPATTTHYVDIARPSKATGMGEKGLTLVNTKPVASGALVRFYHPSLVDHNGRGILARCYKSELKEPGIYHCYFAFFGVKENQLKSIRKLWLSGDEIHKEMPGIQSQQP